MKSYFMQSTAAHAMIELREIAIPEPGPQQVLVGARVMGRCPGAFAEHALMEVCEAMAVPAGVSWEEAASIPLTFLVVHDMVFAQGRLKPGEWVLVTGISSGVGVASLQAARERGAKVIGTSARSCCQCPLARPARRSDEPPRGYRPTSSAPAGSRNPRPGRPA